MLLGKNVSTKAHFVLGAAIVYTLLFEFNFCFAKNSLDGLDVKEVEMDQAFTLEHSRTFTMSYTLPQHRKKMGTRSPTYTDGKDGSSGQTTAHAAAIPEEESDHGVVLMFHGVILRSQLVEMIKNKIFFDENEGVREKLHRVWREGGRERQREGERDYYSSSLLLSCTFFVLLPA